MPRAVSVGFGRRHIGITLAVLSLGLIPAVNESSRAEPARTTPLFDNLGVLHHPITTKSEGAQQYFDQGLRLVYAFNHEEAVNSFEEAARLDPGTAMPSWGIALALGPNINAAMDKKDEKRAYEAIQKARAHLASVTPNERAYIEALAKRYSPGASHKKVDRAKLDQAYADAMREVARQFPDDANAGTLFAEALMNLSPWDYWAKDGRPKGRTEEIVSTLERVMAQHPDHPGACHYYIHAVEASRQPERAVPCAQRLPALMPGAGHLVHMPAHIYMRVGRYREAAERNVNASEVDRAYLSHRHLTGHYPQGYYLHNIHFLWAALLMEGRSAEAGTAARELAAKVPRDEVRKDPWLELYASTPLLTLVRFGRWEDVILEPPAINNLRFTTGMWRYARGLALTATGRLGQAEAERDELVKLVKRVAKAKDGTGDQETARKILQIAERVLAGELAAKRGRSDEAIRILQEGVRLEDNLRYSEPPLWYASVRQNLGAVLLAAGRAAEADAVYREDLQRNPENGWALFGLAQSLRARNKADEAAAVEERFNAAWARADVTPTASRF